MLKKSLVFFAVIFLCWGLSAQSVDPAIAAKIARNIYFQHQPEGQKTALTSIIPELVYTAEKSSLKKLLCVQYFLGRVCRCFGL